MRRRTGAARRRNARRCPHDSSTPRTCTIVARSGAARCRPDRARPRGPAASVGAATVRDCVRRVSLGAPDEDPPAWPFVQPLTSGRRRRRPLRRPEPRRWGELARKLQRGTGDIHWSPRRGERAAWWHGSKVGVARRRPSRDRDRVPRGEAQGDCPTFAPSRTRPTGGWPHWPRATVSWSAAAREMATRERRPSAPPSSHPTARRRSSSTATPRSRAARRGRGRSRRSRSERPGIRSERPAAAGPNPAQRARRPSRRV